MNPEVAVPGAVVGAFAIMICIVVIPAVLALAAAVAIPLVVVAGFLWLAQKASGWD